MMMNIEFKTANFEDISEIHRLVNSAYRGDYSRQGWTTEAPFLDGQRIDSEALEDLIKTKGSRIVLMINTNLSSHPRVVGCMNVVDCDNHLYLGMITVEPTLQNQKLGRRLLEKAEEIARNEFKQTVLRMTVISVRNELIDWYKKRGYHPTGEVVPFPNNIRNGIPKQKLEMIVLEKKLTPLSEKTL